MDETGGFQCLGHSNWTICIPLSPFCSENLSSFSPSYWEANSYYPRGSILGRENSSNSKSGLDRGFSVPRAFKLDHLQPPRPNLCLHFSNIFTFTRLVNESNAWGVNQSGTFNFQLFCRSALGDLRHVSD